MSDETKLISAVDFSEYLVKYFNDKDISITNLKLNKILYYIEAWYLSACKKPLFQEDFQAWVHGPVVPEVYHKYKIFGAGNLFMSQDVEINNNNTDTNILKVVDFVFDVYGRYDGPYLEGLTHSEFPWIQARQDVGPLEVSQISIDKNTMKDFYTNLYVQTQKTQPTEIIG